LARRTGDPLLYKGAVPELAEGDVFAGHRILGVAGRGGMGVVYRAIQLDLDRTVALKLIAPQLAEDAGFRERFVRESRAAASIDHPNVIPIYYSGEHDGALYIAMRYVEGSDLRTLVRAEGRLEPGRAAQIVSQVANALDAAHARGIVHRDVKPANVLLGADNHAYLTDFGLTKRVTSRTGSTREGGWVGTLGYVAPEQIRGEPVDARVDVYALGCVLYHALTGVPPYQRETDEATLWAHLHDDPPSVAEHAPGAPAGFDAVVARALAKDPDDRYPSAGDLGRAALAAAGRGVVPGPERLVATGEAAPGGDTETIVSPDQAPTALAAPPATRRRLWPWALAAVPIAGLALVAAIVLGNGGDGNGATTAATTPSTTTPETGPQPTVSATVKIGGRPNSVTVASGDVWVTRSGNDRLAIVSTKTNKRLKASPRVGSLAADAAAGFGRLWVVNQSGPSVVPIGLQSHKQAGASIPLPTRGKVVAVATDDNAVWVGIRGNPGLLIRYDPRTHRQVKEIPLPDGLQNLAVDEGAAWVLARRANTLTRVDIRTARQQSINVGDQPASVAVGAGAVWVTNAGDGTVTRVDAGSLNTSQIRVGREPQGIALGGGLVWVANRLDSTVTRIDAETQRQVGRPVEVGINPYAIDVTGSQVWVGCLGDQTVQRIDFG
jgi:DNA-binding beta-propeller fold protein YncE